MCMQVLVGDAVARDLKKGGYFGEISMMTGNPPTANVVGMCKSSFKILLHIKM